MKLTVKLKETDLKVFMYAPERVALNLFLKQQPQTEKTDTIQTMLEEMGMDGVCYRFNVDFSSIGVSEEDVDRCIENMEETLSGEKVYKKIEKEIDRLEKLLASLG